MKKKSVIYLLSILLVSVIVCTVILYKIIYGLSIKSGTRDVYIYLPTGSTFSQVLDSINSKITIKYPGVFKLLAEKKRYPQNIRPGRYEVKNNMNYLELINILRSGMQSPVKITINNMRTLNDLAGKVGSQIEPDSSVIIRFLNDHNNYRKDGFNREDVISVFIPDTYEFYWNTSPEGFYLRMLKEYRKFWNSERLSKAKIKNLSPAEVSVLASIIDSEVSKPDEKPRIAGVYLNRLGRDMPLQSDPTIIFALNDYKISRVLNKHLKVDSPYNTYTHTGLPPGPICSPTIAGIDAVLNAEKNDYLFFVAKPDFSGYHNFSRTLAEHNRYANLYQKELDKRRIFK
jgi:UPF0755 protein